MTTAVLKQEDLAELLGYKPGAKAALARALRQAGIKFHRAGNGRIFTTVDALNAGLGLTPKKEEIEF